MQEPEKCIRGILNPGFIDEDGVANIGLFQFRKREPSDDWLEASINWMDDKKAIGFTLNQTKDNGEFKFKVGIAILPRSDLDRIKKRHGIAGHFKYKRASSQDNRYHGNLLLKNDILTVRKRMVCNLLAFYSQIHRREDIINQCKNNKRWYIVVWRLIERIRNFIFSSRKRTKRTLLTTRERKATEHGL